MSPQEAHHLLHIDPNEDLHDGFDTQLFLQKQEALQKIDHVLLYKSWKQKWQTLHEASTLLGLSNAVEVAEFPAAFQPHPSIKETFIAFHHERSKLLKLMHDAPNFRALIVLIHQLEACQLRWMDCWAGLSPAKPADLKLSQLLDAMQWINELDALENQGVQNWNDLRNATFSLALQHELARMLEVRARLSAR
ncbi:MAG: hypothetical protein RLZZ301_812 [Bacteroidota bacterium]|jgi:hypothetical protein